MKLPTQRQIDAGNEITSQIMDAFIRHKTGGFGCPSEDMVSSEFKHIVDAYVNDEIDSVTAIWIAMQEAEENHEST